MVTIWMRGTAMVVPGRAYCPAPAASASMGRDGGVRVKNTPICAPSRSITPRRSRIIATPTLSPALTLTMARPSCFAPKYRLPSMPLSAPFFDRFPGWALISDSAHFSNSK